MDSVTIWTACLTCRQTYAADGVKASIRWRQDHQCEPPAVVSTYTPRHLAAS